MPLGSLLSPTSIVNVNDLLFTAFKVLFLMGLIFYLVFSLLVLRQEEEMSSTLITPLRGVIRLFGFLHVILTIAVILFSYQYLLH